MDEHAIETDGRGGYQVRFTRPNGDGLRVVAGFPTWRSAHDWLSDHVRITGGIVSDQEDC